MNIHQALGIVIEDNTTMSSLLQSVKEWYIALVKPRDHLGPDRDYCLCPVCHKTWYPQEKGNGFYGEHYPHCFIPKLYEVIPGDSWQEKG